LQIIFGNPFILYASAKHISMIPRAGDWIILHVVKTIPFSSVFGQMWVVGITPMVRIIPIFIRPRRTMEMEIIVGIIGAVLPIWTIYIFGHSRTHDWDTRPSDWMGN
jgi:putative copper export protein